MIGKSSPFVSSCEEVAIPTIADHLLKYVTRPDVVERMEIALEEPLKVFRDRTKARGVSRLCYATVTGDTIGYPYEDTAVPRSI
jgi:hypothetical protein